MPAERRARLLGFPVVVANDSGDFPFAAFVLPHMNEFKCSALFLAILDMAEFM